MKYSFMSFSCPELTLDEMLSLAERIGYDGIEPRAEAEHKHGVEIEADAAQRKVIRQKVADSPVKLSCIATSCVYADPATVKEKVARTLQFIDLAADVGCSRLRVFGGVIPEGFSREAAFDQVAAALRSVADRAAERGVAVCLETHDHWCNPDNVAEVMRRADHPAINVNWDVMHPVRQEDWTIDQSFQVLKPWIRHIHFHDGRRKPDGNETDPSKYRHVEMVPVGEGYIDHRRVVKLMQTIPYEGYLSGEWINWEPYEKHLPRELAVMKSYEK